MLCNLRRVLATSSSDKWPLETLNAKQIHKIIHINECYTLLCHWGIEESMSLSLDYQYAGKIGKQTNIHWNNYGDNEDRRNMYPSLQDPVSSLLQ